MGACVIILDVDGLEIPVSVTRKRVKNLNLRVRADGSVALSIPQHLPLARAQEFLKRRGNWIAEHVQHSAERRRPRALDSMPPDRIPLWGELVPLDSVPHFRTRTDTDGPRGAKPSGELTETGRTTPGQADPGQADPGQAAASKTTPGQAAAGKTTPGQTDFNRTALNNAGPDQAALDELYRTEVQRVLPDVAKRMEARIGVHAARWSVRTMKTRWGSCTPKTSAIRINARLAAYPPECLEFVVAHELVHLLEPSHNARFHALLDEFCPGNRAAAQRLKQGPVSNSCNTTDMQ